MLHVSYIAEPGGTKDLTDNRRSATVLVAPLISYILREHISIGEMGTNLVIISLITEKSLQL
jgi:hypothetical protein